MKVHLRSDALQRSALFSYATIYLGLRTANAALTRAILNSARCTGLAAYEVQSKPASSIWEFNARVVNWVIRESYNKNMPDRFIYSAD